MTGISFSDLTEANRKRERGIYPGGFQDWTLTDWACAMAGETGEACNLIKKHRRGDDVNAIDIGRELADIVIYADILAGQLGLDLGELVKLKFNEVSQRRNLGVFIEDPNLPLETHTQLDTNPSSPNEIAKH